LRDPLLILVSSKASPNLNRIPKRRDPIRQIHTEVRISQRDCLIAIDVPLLKRVCSVTSGSDEFRPIRCGTINRETLINTWEDDLSPWAFAGCYTAVLDDPRD